MRARARFVGITRTRRPAPHCAIPLSSDPVNDVLRVLLLPPNADVGRAVQTSDRASSRLVTISFNYAERGVVPGKVIRCADGGRSSHRFRSGTTSAAREKFQAPLLACLKLSTARYMTLSGSVGELLRCPRC